MSHRKHGLKLLGLLAVAALGVLAFASAAQAVVPEFLIAKKTFLKELDATVSGVQELKTVGTLLVPLLNLEIQLAGIRSAERLILRRLRR